MLHRFRQEKKSTFTLLRFRQEKNKKSPTPLSGFKNTPVPALLQPLPQKN